MIVSIRSIRKCFFAPLLIAFAIGLPACGGDDEDQPPAGSETQPAPTTETTTESEPETEATSPDPETETLPDDGDGNATPEGGTGGAGDEEPARTLALFTGVNGRILPRVIRVPAFISVRVELRSGDGASYGLTFAGKTLRAGGELSSQATTLDGLRPGARVIGKATGGAGDVLIEATAEPGP